MINPLKKISTSEAKDLIPDKEILESVEKDNDPIFKISRPESTKDLLNNQLLEIEIALRKCDRYGVFE